VIEFPAITLHQPWASLLIAGLKVHETRGFRLPDRLIGRWVAIHAAQRQIDPPGSLGPLGTLCVLKWGDDFRLTLPRGAVLGLVQFAAAVPTTGTSPAGYKDEISGNWEPGRWAWPVERVHGFDVTPAARGRQLWWRWACPPDLASWVDLEGQRGEARAPTQGSRP
jgi:activating signal cointegrator 1